MMSFKISSKAGFGVAFLLQCSDVLANGGNVVNTVAKQTDEEKIKDILDAHKAVGGGTLGDVYEKMYQDFRNVMAAMQMEGFGDKKKSDPAFVNSYIGFTSFGVEQAYSKKVINDKQLQVEWGTIETQIGNIRDKIPGGNPGPGDVPGGNTGGNIDPTPDNDLDNRIPDFWPGAEPGDRRGLGKDGDVGGVSHSQVQCCGCKCFSLSPPACCWSCEC